MITSFIIEYIKLNHNNHQEGTHDTLFSTRSREEIETFVTNRLNNLDSIGKVNHHPDDIIGSIDSVEQLHDDIKKRLTNISVGNMYNAQGHSRFSEHKYSHLTTVEADKYLARDTKSQMQLPTPPPTISPSQMPTKRDTSESSLKGALKKFILQISIGS